MNSQSLGGDFPLSLNFLLQKCDLLFQLLVCQERGWHLPLFVPGDNPGIVSSLFQLSLVPGGQIVGNLATQRMDSAASR